MDAYKGNLFGTFGTKSNQILSHMVDIRQADQLLSHTFPDKVIHPAISGRELAFVLGCFWAFWVSIRISDAWITTGSCTMVSTTIRSG